MEMLVFATLRYVYVHVDKTITKSRFCVGPNQLCIRWAMDDGKQKFFLNSWMIFVHTKIAHSFSSPAS